MLPSMLTDKAPLITIISVNYNSSDFFRVSIKALERLTCNPWKMVICDNGSKLDDISRLKNLIFPYKNITLLTRFQSVQGSLGHGEALNFLKESIDTPFGVTLDADCIPLMKDWDQFLIDQLDERIKISGTPLAVNTPGLNIKPKDFPLIFLALFETKTFLKLDIDLRPKDISLGQDTGWELREKYSKAGFGGYNLHGQNTRTFKNGRFATTICDEYYTDAKRTNLLCSHLGRGSNPRSGKYTRGKKIRLWHKFYYDSDKKHWLKICEDTIDREIENIARQGNRGLEYAVCPYCGNDNTKKLFSSVDRLNHIPGQWNLVECIECDLVYTNPRPDKIEMLNFYPDSYGPYQDIEEPKTKNDFLVNDKFCFKQKINRQLMRQHFNYFSDQINSSLILKLFTWPLKHRKEINLLPKWPEHPQARALEIGCSHGSRMVALKELGWNVFGIERSPKVAEKARGKGLSVRTGNLDDFDFMNEPFDAIIMNMVLEHMPNPGETVNRISRWLKPNGELLISVPDFNGVESKWFKTYHYGMQVPTHLTHFTPQTLRKTLNGYYCIITHHYFHRDLKAGLEFYIQDHPESIFKNLVKLPRKVFNALAFLFSFFRKSSRMSIRAQKVRLVD